MSLHEQLAPGPAAICTISDDGCAPVRHAFSEYLDGAVSGVEMAAISAHLEGCEACAGEFAAWRDVQRSLGELGPAHPPERLQAELLGALAAERERGTHLPVLAQAMLLWQRSLAPMALRVSAALAVAVVLLAGMSWLFAGPIAVRADDDRLAHMAAPRYLYSQVLPRPIETRQGTQAETPIVVEALVDPQGRVYDFSILEGPRDPEVRLRVAENLLASIFRPATLFGVPVRGHVLLTYSGVSVRG